MSTEDKLRRALEWAMDEIDFLSSKVSGFGYPQGMGYFRPRRSADEYANAVKAREALAATQEQRGEPGREAIRQAVRDFWVCDVNKPSWFRDDQNERLVERVLAAVTSSKSDAPAGNQS